VKPYRWFVGWLAIVLLLSGCGSKARSVETQVTATSEEGVPPTPLPALPTSNVILMDGELVAIYPSLKLAFSGNVSAKLLTLNVEVGQRVKSGELIAILDDGELSKAIRDAQLALDRAREDKAQAGADNEEKYQREMGDADKKYRREMKDADDKYEREKDEAGEALETAEHNLQRAKMEPPTTAVEEARVNLGRAQVAETKAADDYKQALDRPWEPQRFRDSLYKEWQQRIADRELAELRYQDALISLQVYYLDLEAKEREVERARENLAKVERDEVERDEVERETNLTSYERTIEDAEDELAQARENLENARLYAPWDALLLSIDTSVGATVSSGTPIVTLLNVEDLYFVTENLSERHVTQLRKGQQANITLRAYPDTVIAGQVDVVIPKMERKADSDPRFVAHVRLDESELDLLPGMTGRVEIVTEDE